MLGQILGVNFLTPKQGKIFLSICLQTLNFRGTAQQRVDLSPLDFYPWEHLETLVYSAPIESEETLYQHIFLCLSNHLQPRQHHRKGATVHDLMCSCVY
jgi:hypothetical protein